ncbi:hypothetical protein EN812_05740 [Mesorhizobium sp. M4B.F.Ca.ET.169.01.1.1]|uniref:hypothetical protein n=1 Tax=Mesorhizobium sp. M4B.F.Ca.ET.169.01.1.1 TaxID=2563949 RepID=UPI0010937DD9|nr:hypothetical protein [Mesorhizobium sp. M4B.F.Ca.ET.169.01.1.1]TGT46841.1 hypothetical protein EN812_05740 [Mesorhizobium sp. M4B.F.Ca.ET.169.01.1.1]
MDLERAAWLAGLSQATRLHMEKTGVTMRGHPLWRQQDDDVCRSLYPDYKALSAAFPNRSRKALEFRCWRLNITRRNRILTEEEERRFRKLYRSGTRKDLHEGFPDFNANQFYDFGRRRGLKRPRIQWLRSGDKLLDGLRDECWRLGISMADLDEFTQLSNRYFAQHRWCRSPVRHDFVLRAILELGGKVISGQVEWPG